MMTDELDKVSLENEYIKERVRLMYGDKRYLNL